MRLGNIARFLVRYRIVLFVVMALLAFTSVLLVPHININTDMTRYLPDDSPMKQGLDILESQLPAIKSQMQEFGSTLFSNANDLMPTDLPRTMATGVALVFVVLLIMSSSFMEVLLFLITVGFAVIINMGTNALLESVSTMTNTLTSVLQMVLSMDYSIILMNRYKQERAQGLLPAKAMEGALEHAASSILSSAFTTIVSLLMLCFIKLKIGADLGIVLAKGVTLSLLCNFTVLPTLIIWADKAVEKTKKKVPLLPARGLAAFQNRFRYVLAVVFVAAFVSFAWLQRRTPLTFAPQWDSTAAAARTGENGMLLLYSNADEALVPALLDSIGKDPKVLRSVSYPSLAKKPRTIRELKEMAAQMGGAEAPSIPEDLLQLVYYAQTHPQRTEKLSVAELQASVENLSARGLVPADMNPQAYIKKFMADEEVPSAPENETPEPESAQNEPVVPENGTLVPPQDSTATEETIVEEEAVAVKDSTGISYADITTPITAQEMARVSQNDPKQVAMVYRMAGKKNGTMSVYEFLHFVKDNILSKRSYAALVPQEMKDRLAQNIGLVDSVYLAGPLMPADSTPPEEALSSASLRDPVRANAPESASPSGLESAESTPIPEPEPVVEVPPTPQEVLMDMALSGRKYTAARMQLALSAAGIPVSLEQMELLYLITAAQRDFDPQTALSPETLMNYVADTLLTNPAIAPMVPDSTRAKVNEAREQLLGGTAQLCGQDFSAAAVLSSYEIEADDTFGFVGSVLEKADGALPHRHAWIGESVMYKELKDGFPRELLLLTLLTVLSIFLIVALTFRSLLIPIPLVMTILSGVYANIWASGLGGHTLYYLSYLIIQGILMGATIDYSILFTSYYLRARSSNEINGALEAAYRGSSHSILTSGLILSIVPFVMSITMSDPMIAGILKSLAFGAFSVLLFILFLLPGVLAAMDPLIKKKQA